MGSEAGRGGTEDLTVLNISDVYSLMGSRCLSILQPRGTWSGRTITGSERDHGPVPAETDETAKYIRPGEWFRAATGQMHISCIGLQHQAGSGCKESRLVMSDLFDWPA